MQRGSLFLFAPENPATLVFQGLLGLGYYKRWWFLVTMVVPCDSSVKKPGLIRRGLNICKTSRKLPEIYQFMEQGLGNFELLLWMGTLCVLRLVGSSPYFSPTFPPDDCHAMSTEGCDPSLVAKYLKTSPNQVFINRNLATRHPFSIYWAHTGDRTLLCPSPIPGECLLSGYIQMKQL